MSSGLRKRAEVPVELTWRLEDIYPSNEAWETEYQQAEALMPTVAAFEGQVAADARTLLRVLQGDDKLSLLCERLFHYASRRRDEDTTNAGYQAMNDRARSLYIKAGAATSFISPEVIAMAPETLAGYLQQEPGLQAYAHALDSLQRQRPHVRTAEVEQLLAQMGDVSGAPSQIFGMINDADIKFPAIKDENGQELELTKGRYGLLLESKDRRVRKDAFEAVVSTYQKQKHTLAATLATSVKKDIFFAQARNHGSALESALFGYNIPPAVYHTLIDTVESRVDLLHRYVALRKRILGLEQVELYDMYAPLVPEARRTVTFDEAKETIATALAPLGAPYGQALQHAMSDRWIDLLENVGKRSGAYNAGLYGVHPYVLMNWQENLSNMFTLAHELGHAMHSWFTGQTQPYHYSHYTIFVAEVASTFNEALLHHHLMQKHASDKQLQIYLLNHHLDTIRGTLFAQTWYAHFERTIHQWAEEGKALTVDTLSEHWGDLVQRYNGPDFNLTPGANQGWARIPHFYTPFYVYQYATGISAAMALARQVLAEGAPAVQRYLTFLRGGSSKFSIDLLKDAGVDMTAPTPVQQALAEFEDTLTQLEALLA